MGFWKGVRNVVTLGGAHRLDKAKERYEGCHLIYERTVSRLNAANASLETTVKRLRRSFGRTKKTLRTAHKMLYPRCLGAMQVQGFNYTQNQPVPSSRFAILSALDIYEEPYQNPRLHSIQINWISFNYRVFAPAAENNSLDLRL
jgi:DNA relaxase NicK